MKKEIRKQVGEPEPKPVLAEVTKQEEQNCLHPLEALDYREPKDENLTMQCSLCGKTFG